MKYEIESSNKRLVLVQATTYNRNWIPQPGLAWPSSGIAPEELTYRQVEANQRAEWSSIERTNRSIAHLSAGSNRPSIGPWILRCEFIAIFQSLYEKWCSPFADSINLSPLCDSKEMNLI